MISNFIVSNFTRVVFVRVQTTVTKFVKKNHPLVNLHGLRPNPCCSVSYIFCVWIVLNRCRDECVPRWLIALVFLSRRFVVSYLFQTIERNQSRGKPKGEQWSIFNTISLQLLSNSGTLSCTGQTRVLCHYYVITVLGMQEFLIMGYSI